jgi:hypothetical protein
MAPGALDPLMKRIDLHCRQHHEQLQLLYCVSHCLCSAKGMTDGQLAELLAVTGLANE